MTGQLDERAAVRQPRNHRASYEKNLPGVKGVRQVGCDWRALDQIQGCRLHHLGGPHGGQIVGADDGRHHDRYRSPIQLVDEDNDQEEPDVGRQYGASLFSHPLSPPTNEQQVPNALRIRMSIDLGVEEFALMEPGSMHRHTGDDLLELDQIDSEGATAHSCSSRPMVLSV